MENEKKTKLTEIDFHYLKTNSYRSIHVDGVFGGLTPRGNLYLELFLERKPTPRKVKHLVKDSGIVGDEIEREGKAGFIREIECGLIMDIVTAKKLREWIDNKINEFEEIFPGENKKDA